MREVRGVTEARAGPDGLRRAGFCPGDVLPSRVSSDRQVLTHLTDNGVDRIVVPVDVHDDRSHQLCSGSDEAIGDRCRRCVFL